MPHILSNKRVFFKEDLNFGWDLLELKMVPWFLEGKRS
jgi:hypothetical protein